MKHPATEWITKHQHYAAQVHFVVGPELQLEIDAGFGISIQRRLRPMGNWPELHHSDTDEILVHTRLMERLHTLIKPGTYLIIGRVVNDSAHMYLWHQNHWKDLSAMLFGTSEEK